MAEFKRGTGVDHKFGWSGTVATGNVRQRDGRILVSRPQESPLWVDPNLLTETVVRDVSFRVTATATIQAPAGSTVGTLDGNPAITLPGGATLKFWVSAELLENGLTLAYDLDYGQLAALGVTLEPGDGQVAA